MFACARSPACCRAAQFGRTLPLQTALQRGASVEVVAALLKAYPQAEAEVESTRHRAMLDRAKEHGQSSATNAAGAAAGASGGAGSIAVQGVGTASDLVAALKAYRPDGEVLPLITEAAAKQKDEVRRTIYNFDTSTHDLTCRCMSQIGALPLHCAASNKPSEAVVAALLAAYPEAAKEKDPVRLPRPHNPLGRAAPRIICPGAHSLAIALCRMGIYRCSSPSSLALPTRWWLRCRLPTRRRRPSPTALEIVPCSGVFQRRFLWPR